MLLPLQALAAAFVVATEAPRACTVIVRPWLRPDTVRYVVARLESDSVVAARRELSPLDGIPGPRADSAWRLGPRYIPLYGQRGRVQRARGVAVAAGAAIVVVSTPSGPRGLCGSGSIGGSAYVASPGSRVFFLDSGPAAEALADAPTFVIGPSYTPAAFYSPNDLRAALPRRWWRLGLPPRVLAIEEFERFVAAMPTYAAYDADPKRAARSLLAWARAHPELARRSPARETLEAMRLDLESSRETEPGER